MTEAEGWTEWLKQHAPAMVLAARQWVDSHADAEDAVQEALLRFWPNREKSKDPVAMLYVYVKRSALQWRRQVYRRVVREGINVGSMRDQMVFAPMEDAERQEAIERALADLPEPQREVLVMKIWVGLTFPQIAAALGVPADTAASRYRYALEKLRVLLVEERTP